MSTQKDEEWEGEEEKTKEQQGIAAISEGG